MFGKVIKNLFTVAMCIGIIVMLAWALPRVGFTVVIGTLGAAFTGITIGGAIRCLFVRDKKE